MKTDYVAVATITWTVGATSATTSLTGVTTETPETSTTVVHKNVSQGCNYFRRFGLIRPSMTFEDRLHFLQI